jgi:hypothetical protein
MGEGTMSEKRPKLIDGFVRSPIMMDGKYGPLTIVNAKEWL